MNIGIVTQPLVDNYGAILQNYALQAVLKKTGHNPITIDYMPKGQSLFRYILSCIKTFLLLVRKKEKRHFRKRILAARRKINFGSFVDSYISKTESVNKYSWDLISKYNLDCIIVGSDQVWRPKFNFYLYDMFLAFCKNENSLKRIAYAASFGVDKWEYSSKQTRKCKKLAKHFNFVSVREYSGVALCQKYLDIQATWVLDPTLLLKKEDYCKLCENVPVKTNRFMAVYLLNMNEPVKEMCEKIAAEMGLALKVFGVADFSILSVSEWIAIFRDASYIVTDSFHGTVFSIIFEKNFKCLYNEFAGNARFESLLNLYNSSKLDEMRHFSINWLKNALEN